MGLRERIKHALRATEGQRVRLRCRRCGFEVEVSPDVPVTLVAQAAGRGFLYVSQEEARRRDLSGVLSHECSDDTDEGQPFDFEEIHPDRDGTLAHLAGVINRSRALCG